MGIESTLSVIQNKEGLIKKLEEEFPYPEISNIIVETIEQRLGKSFFTSIKCFIFEHPYIEKEWREIYSLHYCKTNYSKTDAYAFRIHLINKNIKNIVDLDSDSYLGYVTVRPLPVPTNFISKIVIKPNTKFYGLENSEKLFMITINQEVHIGNKKIEFHTFPFFSQDSVVTVCAHADMWMVAHIMHKKYELDEISIEKLVSGLSPSYTGRNIPSEGLSMDQIAYTLQANRWYARIKYFSNESEKCAKENTDEIMQYIDSYIESGIPCILAFKQHVIVIAGHTLNENKDRNKNYIIFDDSGYHVKHTFKETEPKFSIKVPVEKLREILLGIKNIAVICPEFERVHFPLVSVHEMMRQLNEAISDHPKIPATKKKEFDKLIKNKNYRTLIVDCKKLKVFLSENNINTFNNRSLPHYVWFVEMYSGERGKPENIIGYVLIDASAHRYDFKYSYIGGYIIKPRYATNRGMMSLLEEFGNLDKY